MADDDNIEHKSYGIPEVVLGGGAGYGGYRAAMKYKKPAVAEAVVDATKPAVDAAKTAGETLASEATGAAKAAEIPEAAKSAKLAFSSLKNNKVQVAIGVISALAAAKAVNMFRNRHESHVDRLNATTNDQSTSMGRG